MLTKEEQLIMPIGPNILVKIVKKVSKIELLNTAKTNEAIEAVCMTVGTKCSLGIEAGDKLVFRSNTMPVIVSETPEYDLIVVPEVSVLYVTNYTRQAKGEAE